MAWTAPKTWTNGEVVDASMLNTHVRDNLSYLKSQVAAQFLLTGASAVCPTTAGAGAPIQTEMATNEQNIVTPTFVDAAFNYAEWLIPSMPDDYNGGTITAKFIWTANSSSANAVVWGLKGRAYADGDALDAAWGTAQEVTDANGASVYTLRVSAATAAITLAGTPLAGKACQIRAHRNGAAAGDTLAATALLLGVAINYTRA